MKKLLVLGMMLLLLATSAWAGEIPAKVKDLEGTWKSRRSTITVGPIMTLEGAMQSFGGDKRLADELTTTKTSCKIFFAEVAVQWEAAPSVNLDKADGKGIEAGGGKILAKIFLCDDGSNPTIEFRVLAQTAVSLELTDKDTLRGFWLIRGKRIPTTLSKGGNSR